MDPDNLIPYKIPVSNYHLGTLQAWRECLWGELHLSVSLASSFALGFIVVSWKYSFKGSVFRTRSRFVVDLSKLCFYPGSSSRFSKVFKGFLGTVFIAGVASAAGWYVYQQGIVLTDLIPSALLSFIWGGYVFFSPVLRPKALVINWWKVSARELRHPVPESVYPKLVSEIGGGEGNKAVLHTQGAILMWVTWSYLVSNPIIYTLARE